MVVTADHKLRGCTSCHLGEASNDSNDYFNMNLIGCIGRLMAETVLTKILGVSTGGVLKLLNGMELWPQNG